MTWILYVLLKESWNVHATIYVNTIQDYLSYQVKNGIFRTFKNGDRDSATVETTRLSNYSKEFSASAESIEVNTAVKAEEDIGIFLPFLKKLASPDHT